MIYKNCLFFIFLLLSIASTKVIAGSDVFIRYFTWSGFVSGGFGLIIPEQYTDTDEYRIPEKQTGAFIFSASRGHHCSSASNILVCRDGNYIFWGVSGDWFYTQTGTFYATNGKISIKKANNLINKAKKNIEPSTKSNRDLNVYGIMEILDFPTINYSSKASPGYYEVKLYNEKSEKNVWYIDDNRFLSISNISNMIGNCECKNVIKQLNEKIKYLNLSSININRKKNFENFMEWWQDGVSLVSP